MTAWVVNLEDPAAADANLVGGKAAQLHRLVSIGMPVPPAFVITVPAFRAHFRGASNAAPAEPPHIHPELATGIENAVRRRFGMADVYLAVRSSAIGEDGAGASFAGQHETYYYVTPSGLTDAVRACWASTWSSRAISYRKQQPLPGAGTDMAMAMAVIVQRMIQADRSGVCFTSDPTGQQPGHAWIEAIWGLGAALVDGRVTPDRLLLDRTGRVVRQQIGRKRYQVAASLQHPQDDRLDPVPTFKQTQPVLTARQARNILAVGLAAEKQFGSPQDLEWSFEGSRFYVLQSRPITTLAPATQSLPAKPQRTLTSRRRGHGAWILFKPMAENFTDPLTPMTADLMRRVLPRGSRFIDGRMYLNLDRAAAVCPFRWTEDQLTDVLLLRGEVPKLHWHWGKLPIAVAAFSLGYLLDGIAWHRTSRLTQQSLGEFQRVCHQVRESPDPDVPTFLHRLVFGRHPLEPVGRLAFYVNVASARYFLLQGALIKLLARYAPAFDRHQVSQLCAGDGQTWSRRMVEEVRHLADVARQDSSLTRQLLDGDGSGVVQILSRLAESHPFVLAVTEFLQRFGHRCMREMELATPRWREDPAALLLMVRNHLRSTAPQRPVAGDNALHALQEALPRRWQRRLAVYLAERIRYYVSLRENTRYYHAMALDATRSKLLDLEARLLEQSRLRLPGDIFFLTWDEADALRRGALDWHGVADTIRRRRRSRSEAARAGASEVIRIGGGRYGARGAGQREPKPDHARERRPPADDTVPAGQMLVLTGQCASPGVAEGRVRIILDPNTAADLEQGDILVAPFTDPAWTPLFPLAGAIVVEVGSFLSHAGTVAREYRVPCLVDVTHCTSRLRDGQRVRVLASEGRLEVLET